MRLLHPAVSLLLAVSNHRPAAPLMSSASTSRPSRRSVSTDEDRVPRNMPDPETDPIYREELWLDSEQVRYAGGGSDDSGIGFCASYSPSTRAGNHTRAVLILDRAPADAESLFALAGRVAISCECVVLVPILRGGSNNWPLDRLATEAWSAVSYLNAAFGAESLAIIANGETALNTLTLFDEGTLDAHALIALCPKGEASMAGRLVRVTQVPLLAICADNAVSSDLATQLSKSLSLNSRLRGDYYVAKFMECTADFMLVPQDKIDAREAERAIALIHSWIDRYCPEGLLSHSRK